MMWFFHQKVSKISMDVFWSKYDHLSFFCDYFSKKKPKFQMTNYEQNEKIDVSKSFIFRKYNVFYLRAVSKSIHRLKLTCCPGVFSMGFFLRYFLLLMNIYPCIDEQYKQMYSQWRHGEYQKSSIMNPKKRFSIQNKWAGGGCRTIRWQNW